MTKKSAIPRGLSTKSRALWHALTRDYDFEPHERLQLENALRWDDRSVELARQAEVADDKQRLTKLAIDAASTSLRYWRILRFTDPSVPKRRPGRPSGNSWSRQRQTLAADAK